MDRFCVKYLEGILVAPIGASVEPSLKYLNVKQYLYTRSEVLKNNT